MSQKKKNDIFETAKVEKRNILNEIRNNSMSLQELRFFSIYLSKINARDKSTRKVTFPVVDFQKIMGLQTLNLAQIRENFTHILQQVVSVPNEKGKGFTSFQLFKRCKLLQNEETGEWIVEIDAHDDALPLMFEFQKNYLSYELWNALRLKSANQIRMYEILKQYEHIGERELTVSELRALLGIAPNEYPRWNNFKARVLDSCQQALKEYTDICYTYEKGRSGRGGAWLSIIFHISKNTEYADPLALNDFIDIQKASADISTSEQNDDVVMCNIESIIFDDISNEYIDDPEQMWVEKYGSKQLGELAEAVNYEFTKEQMEEIFHILNRIDIHPDVNTNSIHYGRVFYLGEKYAKMNVQEQMNAQNGEKIKNRYAYFRKMIEGDASNAAEPVKDKSDNVISETKDESEVSLEQKKIFEIAQKVTESKELLSESKSSSKMKELDKLDEMLDRIMAALEKFENEKSEEQKSEDK